jgi:hypothetical protein
MLDPHTDRQRCRLLRRPSAAVGTWAAAAGAGSTCPAVEVAVRTGPGAVRTGFDLAADIGWARHCCSSLGCQALGCCCYSSHVAAPGRMVDSDPVDAGTKAEVGLVRPAITSVYVCSANGTGEYVAQQVVEDTMR